MPWAGGVYTRGYPSWSNDAASNLPISATKFDTEDNDFAAGLNNCLTRDGLTSPTGTLTWSQTAAVVANFTRASDGTIFQLSRTTGTNNPQLSFANADATGMSISSSFGTLALSSASGVTAGLAVGAVGSPSLFFVGDTNTGMYHVAADDIGIAVNGVQVWDWQATSMTAFNSVIAGTPVLAAANTSTVATQDMRQNLSAGSSTLSFYVANQNRSTAVITSGAGYPTTAQAAIFTTTAIPIVFGVNGSAYGFLNANGQWAMGPSASGAVLTLNGAANAACLTANANSTSGQSFGLTINGGTTSADWSALFNNQAGQAIFEIRGDGAVFLWDTPGGNANRSGYLGIPLNSQAVSYATVAADQGKMIVHNSASAHTFTINDTTVVYPNGATIAFYNPSSGGTVTIALQTTATNLVWAPSSATGNRTLAAGGLATATKFSGVGPPGVWVLTGVGIS